jgi:hypothetical protein
MITFQDVCHRVTLCKLLQERGGFTARECAAALYGYGFDDKRVEIERRVAMWLMGELQKLPKGKAASGEASPVHRRGLQSQLQIADIAIALLDYDDYRDQVQGWCSCEEESAPVARHPPTPELRDLLGQLLDVTRHRAALAKRASESNGRFVLAAHIDGVAARRGETLSVKRLSALAKASTGSISAWRRLPRYKKFVESGTEIRTAYGSGPSRWRRFSS